MSPAWAPLVYSACAVSDGGWGMSSDKGHRWSARQVWGVILAVVGAGLTVLLAFLGNTKSPPPASSQASIAAFAILAQLGAAWVFSGHGRADPTLAQRSVARLFGYAQRANAARQLAEALHGDKVGIADMRQGIGQLSVHLSYLEEGYLYSIDDWRVFHPRAVEQAERDEKDE